MATGTTNAIPTYGEVTGYTANNYIFNPNNNKTTILCGWTTNIIYQFKSKTNLAIFGPSGSGPSYLQSIKFFLCDVTNSTTCPYLPQFITITGGSSSTILIPSGQTATINACGSSSGTVRGTTTIYGPVSNAITLWFDTDNNKYIPL